VGTGLFALDNVFWLENIAAIAVLVTSCIFMGFFGFVFSRLSRQRRSVNTQYLSLFLWLFNDRCLCVPFLSVD
jgi:hypothetical protein